MFRQTTRLLTLLLLLASAAPLLADSPQQSAIDRLLELHGETERDRIERGVDQVAAAWTDSDGDLAEFVVAEFLPRGDQLEATFERFEWARERIDGYMTSMVRDLRRGVDLEIGPLLAIDHRLAAFNPSAHLTEDLYASKLAFIALLNFPRSTLEERLAEGDRWSRREWAERRLTGGFGSRVPAQIQQGITAAMSAADSYINGYNIHLHHLLTADGRRPFPEGLRLISHWGLRDELKGRYADPEGLEKQRLIQQVFERIVRQEIPAVVIDDPRFDWDPVANRVTLATGAEGQPSNARENDERYRHWLEIFRAQRAADTYSPDQPTFIARRFQSNREIPEAQVEALFDAVLSSPLGRQVAEEVSDRLGRPLEPFDIWYPGFKPGGGQDEAELDRLTRQRYPSADAFADDIPRILRELGFTGETAELAASHIVVEPSRGAGHAYGASRRDDNAHLRTRIGAQGMDYKGYNIAVHELGHNVEQVFSMTTIDHTLLQGVPNTAFTEALAFVFQERDLELLGLADGGGSGARDESILDTFWSTREIAGVALVDMKVWRWLYDHPEATPGELRQAVVTIAEEVWNHYFADLFGVRDVPLLAVYSHMIDAALYTPDYPLGHLIAFQIEEHFRSLGGPLGPEFERISRLGRLTPDAWMRQAVGSPLSAQPLLDATARILGETPPKTALSPDGVPIRYGVHGEGDTTLVLIHCWCCDATFWQSTVDRLAGAFRMITVDLAGHGLSGLNRDVFSIEAYGEDVAAVVRAEKVEQPILVGHSMGAFVMIEAARRLGPDRVQGLIAVDSLQNLEREFDQEQMAAYFEALETDFAAQVQRTVGPYFDPATDRQVVERVAANIGQGPLEVGVSSLQSIITYDAPAALAGTDLDLRLVASPIDPIEHATNRRHTRSFEAEVLPGVGHWPMFEKPDELAAALARMANDLIDDD
ncbi:MAG: alpha/beta fold hydrolase [Acidobacteriota bacterium]